MHLDRLPRLYREKVHRVECGMSLVEESLLNCARCAYINILYAHGHKCIYYLNSVHITTMSQIFFKFEKKSNTKID